MTAAVRRGLDYAVIMAAYVATARLWLSFDALAGIVHGSEQEEDDAKDQVHPEWRRE